jgi:limonene-1,2-epoxide hydrolase
MTTSTYSTAPASLERREVLALLGAGAAIVAGSLASAPAGAAQGADRPTSTANESQRVVNDFCASWSTLDPAKVAAFFADHAVYRVTETMPPTLGRPAIMQLLQRFLQRAQQVRFEILREYAVGPIVVNERHDHFRNAQGERVFHVAGVFFVRDGKIAEWTDYMIRP